MILDPPSGHTDSYLDIRFRIDLEEAVSSIKVRLFNDTVKEQLKIIAIVSGYISRETTAIVTDTDHIEGYINLFSDDKMNRRLSAFPNVDIWAEVELTKDNKTEIVTLKHEFYNESKSLDSSVLPFDLVIEKSEINLDDHETLRLYLITDVEKNYELSIRSEDAT